jgi:hypothetical protein
MIDRYSKIVLTVIAAALVYLCIVMTAFPAVQAQVTQRPGEFTGRPIDAVIVGWKITEPLQIATTRPIPVQTERSTGAADRMVIVGWEENAAPGYPGVLAPIQSARRQGLPVSTLAR